MLIGVYHPYRKMVWKTQPNPVDVQLSWAPCFGWKPYPGYPKIWKPPENMTVDACTHRNPCISCIILFIYLHLPYKSTKCRQNIPTIHGSYWIISDSQFPTFLRIFVKISIFLHGPPVPVFLSGHLLNYSLYTHNPQRQEAPVIWWSAAYCI